jgi:hypothetical protein
VNWKESKKAKEKMQNCGGPAGKYLNRFLDKLEMTTQ